MVKQSLSDLLAEVDALFPQDKAHNGVIIYSLNRFKHGWSFDVTTSWSEWSDAGHEWRFTGDSPENAINGFLAYVRRQEIEPATLMAM